MGNEKSLKLYSPLTAYRIPDDAGYGWDEPAIYDDPEPLSGRDLAKYRGRIQAALADDAEHAENGINLFAPRDERVCEKVKSIVVTVCVRGGQLMGCTAVRLEQDLTDAEMRDLQRYISGQFSDGWGESFEQREIRVDDGILYVHFWKKDDFFFRCEYDGRQQEQAEAVKPVLPHIDLAGPDGNIYAVLGKAGRALRQVGQGDRAREMERRVLGCGSYGEALGIIGEYVRTDLPQAQTGAKPRHTERGDAR